MSYAVIVSFKIKQEYISDFMPLMIQQANNSLKLEKQCTTFDVWTDTAFPVLVSLYEVYADANAFQEHLASEHFKKFDQAVSHMIEEKNVSTFNQKV